MSSHRCRGARLLAVLLSTLAVAACGESGSGGQKPAPILGDVRFEEVVLPAEAVAGHPFPVHVRLIAEAEKRNVTVLLRLVKLDGTEPAAADLTPVTHDERVWSSVIRRMEAGVEIALDEAVDLPATIETGDYAAVLELNTVDFTSDDDELQGEEAADLANNVVVHPGVVHVMRPTEPDLQFDAFALVLHHFALPEAGEARPTGELFAANLAVESKSLPATEEFAVEAELGIPDAAGILRWYPLLVGAAAPDGGYAGPLGRYAFAPRTHLLADGTSLTAALPANRAQGIHLGFFASPGARDALAALEAPTDCEVRVHVDRPDTVAEHLEDNNTRITWARFYPNGFDPDWFTPADLLYGPGPDDGSEEREQALSSAASPIPPGVVAENVARIGQKHDAFGNDSFGASYSLEGAISYAYSGAGGSILDPGFVFTLYDHDGKPLSYNAPNLVPGANPLLFQVENPGGVMDFRRIVPVDLPGLVLSACGSSGNEDGPLVLVPDGAPAGCTGFRFIPDHGQVLENGNKISIQAANYLLVGARNGGYAADYDTWTFQTRFVIRAPSASGLARHLRLTTDDAFGVTVFGRNYTPLRSRAVGALDLDAADLNLFAYRVEAFDVAVADEYTPFAVDSTGTVTLFDREQELYSREVSRSRDFLLGGVVPITVTATARAEVGLRGRVTAGPDRRLTAGLGPYVDVTGSADARVDYAVADAGVACDLRFLKVTQLYDHSLVLTDENTKRYEFGGELLLQTLDGDVYIYADTVAGCGWVGESACHWERDLLSWSGYSTSYDWPATVGEDL